MDKNTFNLLLAFLIDDGELKSSLLICEGQMLLLFIIALTGITNRLTAERWQHSGSTASLVIHEVAKIEQELDLQKSVGCPNLALNFSNEKERFIKAVERSEVSFFNQWNSAKNREI